MADSDELLFTHHHGWTTAFARTNAAAASIFGGSMDLKVSGAPFGPLGLHQIGIVALADLAQALPKPFSGLPLLYGMCFDGCELSYRVAEGEVDIQSITPDQSCDDWPYESYPSMLPAVPLIAKRVWRQGWDDFRQLAPNLNERENSMVTILVPPPANLGFSLWGPDGDAEEVTLVFQYSPADDTVRAFNVCG